VVRGRHARSQREGGASLYAPSRPLFCPVASLPEPQPHSPPAPAGPWRGPPLGRLPLPSESRQSSLHRPVVGCSTDHRQAPHVPHDRVRTPRPPPPPPTPPPRGEPPPSHHTSFSPPP